VSGSSTRRKTPSNRYELLTCALRGHALVGVDAAAITDADDLFVREIGGLRWYRCLRCDDWVPKPVPTTPQTDRVPPRAEVEVPMRGPQLRDRYVLRLIALDRFIHVVILTTLALVIFVFLDHRASIENDYNRIMGALTGGPNGRELHGVLGRFRHWFFTNPAHLYEVGIAALAYAALEATEMVGLWFAKRWAEYLTFVATVVFLPLEIYELTHSITVLKSLTFAINLAIALYLLLAKRLFGLRGGHKAVVARRTALGGWAAVEAGTVRPPGPTPADAPPGADPNVAPAAVSP